ncbi:MAG: M3 family oligoendopeptidase, partial [Pseudolabrys sp.]|nr:M3 family oligoendopeptidase [Pseudolabrys sp.]
MPARTAARKKPALKTAAKPAKLATKAVARLGALPEWNLTDLYPAIDSPALKADLEKGEADCIGFEKDYKGKLGDLAANDPQSLAAAVKRYEAIEDLLGRVVSYASLVYAGNTVDPVRAKFYGDVQERITAMSLHLLFFTLELNRIDDAVLDHAVSEPQLGHYRPWLEDVRKEKPYQLEDRVEQLFHEKSTTAYSAWNRLYDETVASLRFRIGTQELPIEPALNLLQDVDGKKRKTAAEALAKTFRANLRPFTQITNTLAKDKEISDRWRGFQDVADARHLSNRVEREVVDALVSAVRASYPQLSHRYYALKAKWFGKKKLPHWDRNAPLPKVAQRTIPWADARNTVLTAYGAFSPKMAEVADRFFEKNWIDAPVRPGKQPGAFAHPTVPSAHPYVLLNYQGKPRDVMTLAHELSHGVHQVLAAPNGPLMAPTPLTLAETASVFGEMLTFRKLLANTTDKKQRKAMLSAKVEDMINTVVRQIAFYSFERKVHTERRNGELTSDKICELWMSVQSESLGPAIELKEGYETFWTYIPH